MDTLPNALGIAGALIAVVDVVYLGARYPRRCRPPASVRDELDFVSAHGGVSATPSERNLFRWGQTSGALSFAVFAAWQTAVVDGDALKIAHGGGVLAALALLAVAWLPFDAPSLRCRRFHAISALTFFTGSIVAVAGLALEAPTLPRAVGCCVLAPTSIALIAVSLPGLVAGHGLALYHEHLPANRALRDLEQLAVVVIGINWLVVALPIA